jgi:hypothetical protein
MPKLDFAATLGIDFCAETDQNRLDPKWNGLGPPTFLGSRSNIFGVVEVEFVNGRKAVEAIRPKHQIEGLAKSALADVV